MKGINDTNRNVDVRGNYLSEKELTALKSLAQIIGKQSSQYDISLKKFITEDEGYIRSNFTENYLVSVRLSYKYLLKYFSPTKIINSITFRDADLFIRSLKKRAPKGYLVYTRNIRAGFNRAISWGYLTENQFYKVKIEKRQKNKPCVIDELDINKICKHINNKIVEAAIRFDFYTGLRVCELINVRWSNIDLNKKILTIGDHLFVTKGKKQRFIPLCDKAIEALNPLFSSRKKDECYVFVKRNGIRYTAGCISKKFKKACRVSGVNEKIHMHSIRHSFASNLIQKEVPVYSVKELLGHSSIACTEIYINSNLELHRKAVEKL